MNSEEKLLNQPPFWPRQMIIMNACFYCYSVSAIIRNLEEYDIVTFTMTPLRTYRMRLHVLHNVASRIDLICQGDQA